MMLHSTAMNSSLLLLAFNIVLVWRSYCILTELLYCVNLYIQTTHTTICLAPPINYGNHFHFDSEIYMTTASGLSGASDQHVTEFPCSVGVDRVLLVSNLQWKCLINVHPHGTLLRRNQLNIHMGHCCQRWKISSLTLVTQVIKSM